MSDVTNAGVRALASLAAFWIVIIMPSIVIIGALADGTTTACHVESRWFYVGGFSIEYACRLGAWLSESVR